MCIECYRLDHSLQAEAERNAQKFEKNIMVSTKKCTIFNPIVIDYTTMATQLVQNQFGNHCFGVSHVLR